MGVFSRRNKSSSSNDPSADQSKNKNTKLAPQVTYDDSSVVSMVKFAPTVELLDQHGETRVEEVKTEPPTPEEEAAEAMVVMAKSTASMMDALRAKVGFSDIFDEVVEELTSPPSSSDDESVGSIATSGSYQLKHEKMVLEDLKGGLVFQSFSRSAMIDEATHLLIKVMACTFSPKDAMKCSGIGVTKFMLPFVPGEVVIGTIEGMGEDVGSEVEKVFEVGDRVIGVVDSGGCSRFLSAEAVSFVKAPSNLSNSTALALMQDWMPAYRALTAAKNSLSRANLFGMNILITDAMSAPGQALIALASEERANIYCCAEKTHHEYLKSLSSTITCFEPQPEKWLPDLKKKMHVAIDSTCVDGYVSSCAALGKNGVLITLPYVRFDEKRLFGLFDVSWIWRQINFAKAKFTNVRVPTSQIIAIDPMEEYKFNPDSEDENSAEKRVDFVRDFQYLALLHERGTIKPNICEKISLRALSSVQNQFKNGVVGTGGTVVCMPWRRAGNFVLNVFES